MINNKWENNSKNKKFASIRNNYFKTDLRHFYFGNKKL